MEEALINFRRALSLSPHHFQRELRIKFNQVQYFFLLWLDRIAST